MEIDDLGPWEAFSQLSRGNPETVGPDVNFGWFIVPGAEFFGKFASMPRFPFLPEEFRVRIPDVRRRIFYLLQDSVFFSDRFAEDRIDQGSGRAGDVDGFVHRRVIGDPHFVE